MKKIQLSLLAILAVASSAQAAELYLNRINNQTVHKIKWEKLPLPGMLGKMRPATLDRFGSAQPRMPLIPPVTLSFKNPNKHSQAVLVELKLVRRTLKRRPRKGEDPKKYEFTELLITLKDTEGNTLQRWSERIDDAMSYQIAVNIKGLNLQKTDVAIMKKETA